MENPPPSEFPFTTNTSTNSYTKKDGSAFGQSWVKLPQSLKKQLENIEKFKKDEENIQKFTKEEKNIQKFPTVGCVKRSERGRGSPHNNPNSISTLKMKNIKDKRETNWSIFE